jgi:AraC family transcriptional regulator
MLGISELYLAQEDGGLPTMLAAGSAPGESGVSVLSVRFHRGAHLSATLRRHLFCFMSPVRIDCRIASRTLRPEPPAGSLAICPAGTDCAADTEESVGAFSSQLIRAISRSQQQRIRRLKAQLIECLPGYDPVLLALTRKLALESADGYPNGPLFWNEVASGFIDGLAARHMSELKSRVRGMLGKEVLKRLRDYIVAHLDEPIEVAALANIAGRSSFHFSRVFTRSVGLTPHRYVVHLRLQRAIELVRDGRSSLVEIAAATGFADRSHLSRWMRRVHGASLTQLDHDPNSRNLHDQSLSSC